MRSTLLLGLILLGAVAGACLWDSDTLKAEAANKMDLVRVITGRFERWPAKYYEMRLERVKKELADPTTGDAKRLDLYDDAAVALDRLHRDDEAITLIEQKRALLTKLDPKVASQKDHWYRYYANAGTFWAHRWFAKGADRAKIDQMRHARDLIAKAIEINPNAHFGREKYQLLVMEWVIHPLKKIGYGADAQPAPEGTPITPNTAIRLSDFIVDTLDLGFQGNRPIGAPLTAPEKGLGGLIMLGAGWESVDMFDALVSVSDSAGDTAIASLALQREAELMANGKHSILTRFDVPDEWHMDRNTNATYIKAEFQRLRAEADRWASDRSAFVLKRLSQRKHPDTDKDFWEGYVEAPAPALEDIPVGQKLNNWAMYGSGQIVLTLTMCCFVPLGGAGGIWWYVRRRRRLRAALPPS